MPGSACRLAGPHESDTSAFIDPRRQMLSQPDHYGFTWACLMQWAGRNTGASW